ncbi:MULTISPECIES: hypothetical protein [unclassified Nitrobacter]|uniref:hypothetical protein n=1 Tax=unclassified Nitrobacter TaxID=2620411 RepID=UPI0009299BF1|nr:MULTISPECIES: hypothetical protein [unclassified Nitrobacter]MBN9146870.1 hypothetical protein [Nitrobacter sp.]OJU99876.1 MAG: hypothetical protein BGO16_14940 [Nitrobacter sp. 62-23]
MLQILGRVFLTIVIPIIGGYLGTSLNTFDIYLLLATSWSFWAYAQPGPRELWQTGGWAGVLKGWLLMAIAILMVAGPAYGVGYLIARAWSTTGS